MMPPTRMLLAALFRSYVRYIPFSTGKRYLWARVIDPYFAWKSHPFVASTLSGIKMKGDAKDIIPQYIYYFGIWEPHITRWVSRCLAPGDTFVDVGANVGYYSLLASRLVGKSGTVVAIEASPQTVDDLLVNLELNGASNVRVINVAASESEGTAKIYRGHEYNTGLTTTLEGRGFDLEGEVHAAPLSAILKYEELQAARLIKIDVEGAEWSVVAGMESLIKGTRPDLEIIIEVNPELLARRGKTPAELLKPFLSAGYHTYLLENDYSPQSYIPLPREKRPQRSSPPIQQTVDLVLSRQDAEYL
ncbi:MAG: FkbM family methyltransferase [Chloroflexota bacterium]